MAIFVIKEGTSYINYCTLWMTFPKKMAKRLKEVNDVNIVGVDLQ